MKANDQINELVDIALELKQQIENKDIDKLGLLFEPNAKVNIYGHFYTLKTLLSNLFKILGEIEQPGLDITSVDESEISPNKAFIAYSVEIFWIDQKTWEEISQLATISLELTRDLKQRENWLITGFTLARNKKIIEKEEVPIFPKETKPPSSGPSFLDGIFNFWY